MGEAMLEGTVEGLVVSCYIRSASCCVLALLLQLAATFLQERASTFVVGTRGKRKWIVGFE